jgi:hypothetical protein
MSTPSSDPAAAPADAAYLPPVSPLAGSSDRPATETRPEILVGAAFAGGLILAKLLGRVRGR